MSETKAPAFVSTVEQEEKLQAVIAKYKGTDGALIPVLHEAQNIFGYLPIEVQQKISDGLDVPMSEIYGVVTFPRVNIILVFVLVPLVTLRVAVILLTRLKKSLASKLANVPQTENSHLKLQDVSAHVVLLPYLL